MDKQDVVNLKKRYLIWLYKTTKEALDRFERKFTQLGIDEEILKAMENALKGRYLPHEKKFLNKLVNDFRLYVCDKEKACLKLKYKGKKINPEYLFLEVKLEAIEKIIGQELGAGVLRAIKELYQQEMTRRILQEKENKK